MANVVDSDVEDLKEEEKAENGPDGTFNIMLMVPPKLSQGDYLTPFQFSVFNDTKKFAFFGRYNEEKDAVEFALAGSPGSGYKMCISDGNSPYGWKIKRHGITKTNTSPSIKTEEGVGTYVMYGFRTLMGQSSKSRSEEGNEMQKDLEEVFDKEDGVAVPHAMMRSSSRQGIMDAKYECVKPWSFYGPSLPEYFCRCKVKVIVYGDDDDHAEKIKAVEEGSGDQTFPGQSRDELADEKYAARTNPDFNIDDDAGLSFDSNKLGIDSDEGAVFA